MSSNGDSIATPVARGAIAAILSLGTALAVVVVPALAAQVAGTRSSATVLDAVIIALNLLVLGHGGGIVLSTGVVEGAVTLTPFGLLIVLLAISLLGMRRVGRALRLVRDDGVLRARALRDAGGALGSYAFVYAVGLAVLAGIGRSAEASPVVTSALVSGAMIAVLGGLAGVLFSLRRDATSTVPGVRVLDLLPSPYGDIARAALIAVVGLLGLGMLVTVVMLLVSLPAQSSLFESLSPGIVGGIVLTLIQLALLPLLALWALVVVAGGTIGVGTSTGISLAGAETGVMPALPMLGALPGPGDFPGWMWALLVLPAIPVAAGAVNLVGNVADLELRDRVTAWIAYPASVILAVLLLAGLSTGGIGDGRLVHLGPQMDSLVLPLTGIVAVSTAVVLVVMATPLIDWSRALVAALREKVEGAEKAERSETTHLRGRTAQNDAHRHTPSQNGSDTQRDVPESEPGPRTGGAGAGDDDPSDGQSEADADGGAGEAPGSADGRSATDGASEADGRSATGEGAEGEAEGAFGLSRPEDR
ncbi:DUF6350 family protein [Brachybacterium sp. GCM10030268]|uniref:cell division protein PerM n=1 Tax=Brachybacterium sp. GCM10030268 TaxID=3273382 RepID=UPI00360C8CF4